MSKLMTGFLIVFIILGLIVGYRFGGFNADTLVYLGKMIAGWLGYTLLVAVLYAALEKVFPGFLRAPANDEQFAPDVTTAPPPGPVVSTPIGTSNPTTGNA